MLDSLAIGRGTLERGGAVINPYKPWAKTLRRCDRGARLAADTCGFRAGRPFDVDSRSRAPPGSATARFTPLHVGVAGGGHIASNFSKHGVKFFFGIVLQPWVPTFRPCTRSFNGMHVVTAFVFTVALIAGHS
jgi:hypothetical protein